MGGCSKYYYESRLPNRQFNGATVFPFIDDLYIQNGTNQGVYYAINGNAPNRTVIFEYYTTGFDDDDDDDDNPTQSYQFQILFFEAKPNIVQFIYFNISHGGKYGTVGVQGKINISPFMLFIYYLGSGDGPFMQYSFREPFSILPNMSITFDTNQNTYTAILFCGSKTCTINETCIQDMCVQRGSLSFVARWSPRKGRGHIIVRTPLNNTIYFGNPRTKLSIDEGQHEQVGDGSQIDSIYWPSHSIPSKGFYNICFSTGSLLNGTDKSPLTVTVEIRGFQRPVATMTHIFNKSTTSLDKCLDTSDTFIGSYSTGMF